MKKLIYEGTIPRNMPNQIFLIVDLLKKGKYELVIKKKGKVIKRVDFEN